MTERSSPELPVTPTLIVLPNTLREKTGGSFSARYAHTADQAVGAIAGEFGAVLGEALAALLTARRDLAGVVLTQTNTVELFKQALELKSMGTLCGYPLITRVASSLCRLLVARETDLPHPLVEAHVDTLRAILHGGTASASDQTAKTLATELEAQVERFKNGT